MSKYPKALDDALMDLWLRDLEGMLRDIAISRTEAERQHCLAQLRGFCGFIGIKFPEVVALAAIMNSKGVKVSERIYTSGFAPVLVASYEFEEYRAAHDDEMKALGALFGKFTKRQTREALRALHDKKEHDRMLKGEEDA